MEGGKGDPVNLVNRNIKGEYFYIIKGENIELMYLKQ